MCLLVPAPQRYHGNMGQSTKNSPNWTLSTLNFDASVPDINYFTAEIALKYNYYDYFIYEAATATDATMPPDYRRSSRGVIIES